MKIEGKQVKQRKGWKTKGEKEKNKQRRWKK